jgi:hypothetical protein
LNETVTDKKKTKRTKAKDTEKRRQKLSLYPISFDEAVSALIKTPKQSHGKDKDK